MGERSPVFSSSRTPKPHTLNPSSAMPARILVVDDEPDLHLLIRQSFKRQADQWTFDFAHDGEEALAKLDAAAFDIVLTDINMPRMDGLTLLSHIRERDRSLRVVIVSAYGDMDNIRTAMNRGAYDFVTKPINLADLKTTIEKTWQEVQATREAEAARTQLETTRHELEVARQMQALKTRFFADLSHEFRTPLTLILGPLQDALRGAYGQVRHLPGEMLPVMHRHAARLKNLIDQLLDLTKIEAGRMTLRASEHDVIAFVRDLVLSFASAAERKQIDLRFATPPGEAILLYFEPDKLEKIAANLLSNALKFTPSGGTIRVRVFLIGDAEVGIEVRDNGPGIPHEAQTHLFDRFYQIDQPDPDATPGTGIGLALTKELVELHGGSIAVESEPGFGATFTVCLPRGHDHLREEDILGVGEREGFSIADFRFAIDEGEDEALEEGEVAESKVQNPKSKILVVEDNPDVRAYVRGHLAGRYEVIEAEDGAEGLAQARAEQPDLIISDVMMPKMSGYDLCRALKDDDVLRIIPIILLTARAEDEDRLEGLGLGADAYLSKPFNAEELLLRVENLIEIRRLLRQRFSDEVVLKPHDIVVPSADAAFLERVQAFVEAHMGDSDFEVARVADEVGVSPRQLRRKIRAITGLSPSGYVRTLRLQRAAQLLEKKVGGVAEVAYRVGFDDAKHFSRLFKQVYGTLPSEYGSET